MFRQTYIYINGKKIELAYKICKAVRYSCSICFNLFFFIKYYQDIIHQFQDSVCRGIL